ncbi:ATP-binding cassette domain-containing protein [Pleionea sp. CnH1-48]|nr:ATP-binding cassette domain-containing protein [Pleionea sp. CnH1-48]
MLTEFPAPYSAYVEAKEKQLQDEEQANALFDKKLAQEEVWIRQGIKARRTRNEGRVRALKKMRDERSQRRQRQTTAQLHVKSGGQSGKRVAVIENATLRRGDKLLFEDFSATILKGDKIGIVGPNGIGKSSLIQMILGEIEPNEGTVELGTNLDIAYFDQLRTSINTELSVSENIGEGRDFIEVGGEKRHVISYLGDYGFAPERMRTPAKALSGGEISRLTLAKLFTKSANLLILDEPTNDLDVETLELLESQIVDFKGTVLVISHDRRFLDNVSSTLLVYDLLESGKTQIIDIAGGYQDWLRYSEERAAQQAEKAPKEVAQPKTETKPVAKKASKKLSYKLQRELEQLPQEIDELETCISDLESQMGSADFQAKSRADMDAVYQQLADQQALLEEKFLRWEELEALKNEA